MARTGASGFEHKIICAMRGHQRAWSEGTIFGPTWTCHRCGKSGGLEEASKMPLGEYLVHAGVTAAVVLIIWLLIRAVFCERSTLQLRAPGAPPGHRSRTSGGPRGGPPLRSKRFQNNGLRKSHC